MKTINIKTIRIDGGTQPRESINMETVGDYAEGVKAGIEFPPVVVFYDGAEYWLADGFHRYHAHTKADKASIAADVRQGTLDDAKLFASGSNGDHGLRRTNADKRRAVLMALGVKSEWSDSRLAAHVGVSHPFVADVRRSILKPLQDTPVVRTVERAGKTYQQDTSKIGKATKPAAPAKPKKIKSPDIQLIDPALAEKLDEAQEAVSVLSEENDRLNDRLAIESMEASDEEKRAATETIAELRAKVKTLEAELSAVKASRDGYMRELQEVKKQCFAQQKQLKKFREVA